MSRRLVLGGGAATAVVVAGVGAWALLKPGSAQASRSIAVLPFANLSGDPSQGYFSDGIAEEIRGALGRIAGLKVVGRTSSEAVRNDDAETAARKLDVASILTGSVRQSPSTIRVSAELIDGHTGLDKWSQDYDRNPGDTIKIQTDIAENVASALSAALGAAARQAVAVGGTSNAAAQDLYLKARAQVRVDNSEAGLRSAMGLLDSAIALDPRFADAYAAKAGALSDLSGFFTGTSGSFGPGLAQAATVAQRAISLAPDLPAGHMALAYARLSQLNVGAAAVEFERGHSLVSGDVGDLLDYGLFLSILDKPSEAIAIARQAQARDPLNPVTYGAEAESQRRAGNFPQAVAAYRKALALAPNRVRDRAWLGICLMEMGQFGAASAEFRKVSPDEMFRVLGETIMFERQHNRPASDAALARAQQLFGDSANYQYAEMHAQRGETEQAFAALDRSWQFRDPGLAYMKSDPWLKPLRSDPRFAEYLRKMNFPSA